MMYIEGSALLGGDTRATTCPTEAFLKVCSVTAKTTRRKILMSLYALHKTNDNFVPDLYWKRQGDKGAMDAKGYTDLLGVMPAFIKKARGLLDQAGGVLPPHQKDLFEKALARQTRRFQQSTAFYASVSSAAQPADLVAAIQ